MSCSIGIIGAAGYTGGELLRILLRHPRVSRINAVSTSFTGPVSKVHGDLAGETDLEFCSELGPVDLVFLCLGHGKSREWIEQNRLGPETRIIDLSQDFRLDRGSIGHANKDRHWAYGLVDLISDFYDTIREHRYDIANPGCFATCIQQGLLPLVEILHEIPEFNVCAITGSTGAGASHNETSHFSWRASNAQVYRPLRHQHLAEINATVAGLANGAPPRINFIPMRGAFTRGILACTHFRHGWELEKMIAEYEQFYEARPFVHRVDAQPDVKAVVNTNKCLYSIEKVEDTFVVTTAIDNLLRGASGQAVQNMNLLFGFPETEGLHLKSVAF